MPNARPVGLGLHLDAPAIRPPITGLVVSAPRPVVLVETVASTFPGPGDAHARAALVIRLGLTKDVPVAMPPDATPLPFAFPVRQTFIITSEVTDRPSLASLPLHGLGTDHPLLS